MMTVKQWALLKLALHKLLASQYSPQMQWGNVDTAMEYLQSGDARVHPVGDFVVVTKAITIWYSTEVFLMEMLVIRISNEVGNKIGDVVEYLEYARKMNGAVAVVTGDAQKGLMSPVYLKAGFRPCGQQFIK